MCWSQLFAQWRGWVSPYINYLSYRKMVRFPTFYFARRNLKKIFDDVKIFVDLFISFYFFFVFFFSFLLNFHHIFCFILFFVLFFKQQQFQIIYQISTDTVIFASSGICKTKGSPATTKTSKFSYAWYQNDSDTVGTDSKGIDFN